MGKIYKRQCNYCGIVYTGKGKYFCSRPCAAKGIVSPELRAKQSAGHKRSWTKERHAIRNARDQAAKEAKSIECNYCGTMFYKPDAWKKRTKKHYCSKLCGVTARIGTKAAASTRKKMSEARLREKNPGWKGGRFTTKGYVYILINPTGPAVYRREHDLIIERIIGRSLVKGEVVHHKNEIKNDNRPENLQLMTISEHMKLHRRLQLERKKSS